MVECIDAYMYLKIKPSSIRRFRFLNWLGFFVLLSKEFEHILIHNSLALLIFKFDRNLIEQIDIITDIINLL